MKSQVPHKFFDSILRTIKHFPQEASLEEISQALVPSLPKSSVLVDPETSTNNAR